MGTADRAVDEQERRDRSTGIRGRGWVTEAHDRIKGISAESGTERRGDDDGVCPVTLDRDGILR